MNDIHVVPTGRKNVGVEPIGGKPLDVQPASGVHWDVQQDVIVSSGNSSTANLSAGATFTGSSQSTLGVSAIQVSLKTDQNCTVYVDQSPDGSNWDITDIYNYNKYLNNFGITVQAVNSYFRVRVTNLSTTAATTYFRLQSVLCPMVEALPRSLDVQGHLLTHVHGLNDHYGFEGQYTPMRDQKTAQPFRLVGAAFGSAIDANFWVATTSGAGAASGVANGIATISSGTANNGYGQLQTARSARFVFAHPNQFRAAIRLPDLSEANNTRRWGAFTVSGATPQNGCYFEADATGKLSVCYVSGGGAPTKVASGDWNGTVSEYTLDANVHAYEIIYFTMGIWFYIDNTLVHHVTPTTAVLSQTQTAPITITSVNSASGTESADVECWNAMILRLGRDSTSPISKYQSGTTAGLTLKIGAGELRGIAVSGVSNNSVITLYDNTAASGTVIWSSGAMGAITTPFSINFANLPFFIGLTLAITAANSTVTVTYE